VTRYVSDVLDIMRRAISRPNENDPDSTDALLLSYLNDFISLTMSDDVKLYENFGTISFTIDETVTDGVYTFPSVDTSEGFVNTLIDALISLTDPVDNSVSWNKLRIYQNPGEFYGYWGINNTDTLIAGFPTEMLYYGNQFVFRTIPNDSYTVNIYGYKKNPDFGSEEQEIPFDQWLRYLAYGAAKNYAADFKFGQEGVAQIEKGFAHERKLMLTRTHNQRKNQRAAPRF